MKKSILLIASFCLVGTGLLRSVGVAEALRSKNTLTALQCALVTAGVANFVHALANKKNRRALFIKNRAGAAASKKRDSRKKRAIVNVSWRSGLTGTLLMVASALEMMRKGPQVSVVPVGGQNRPVANPSVAVGPLDQDERQSRVNSLTLPAQSDEVLVTYGGAGRSIDFMTEADQIAMATAASLESYLDTVGRPVAPEVIAGATGSAGDAFMQANVFISNLEHSFLNDAITPIQESQARRLIRAAKDAGKSTDDLEIRMEVFRVRAPEIVSHGGTDIDRLKRYVSDSQHVAGGQVFTSARSCLESILRRLQSKNSTEADTEKREVQRLIDDQGTELAQFFSRDPSTEAEPMWDKVVAAMNSSRPASPAPIEAVRAIAPGPGIDENYGVTPELVGWLKGLKEKTTFDAVFDHHMFEGTLLVFKLLEGTALSNAGRGGIRVDDNLVLEFMKVLKDRDIVQKLRNNMPDAWEQSIKKFFQEKAVYFFRTK